MLNEELYEELEHEFTKCRIDEEVEDVLLELAEALADTGITGREISVKEQAGHARLVAWGHKPGAFAKKERTEKSRQCLSGLWPLTKGNLRSRIICCRKAGKLLWAFRNA